MQTGEVKPRKILIFSLAYYPSFVSGAEGALKEITDRIDPGDIEFHLITHWFDKSVPREEKLDNTIVYRVGFGNAYISKILFVPLAALKARSLYKTIGVDAMWAMMTYMLMPLTVARWLGVNAPYMLTLQDGDPYEKVFGRWFIKPALPIIDTGFRGAKVIQVISSYLGEWPRKRGYQGEVIKIFNGGNPRDFDPHSVSDAELAELRNALGIKTGDAVLVNTARLVHQKAFDVTIKALKDLPEHVKFLIVGAGNEEEMLRDLTTELGLDARVIFAGKVDRSEVTAYRRLADIFVMPSRSEGLGNAGLSSMASRTPFVGTRVGGLAEYVFDTDAESEYRKTAWVVEPDQPDQIVKAVQEILTDSSEVVRVTTNARKMVEEKYHWDQIARDMRTKVFEKLWT